MVALHLQPITYREACEFVKRHHRHHKPPQGWLFGTAVNDGENIVGVVMVGRPVSRHLDAEGYTAEVTRLCTDGTPHVASKLYAAAWRAAKALGYRRLITYVLASETGGSVKAAGWREVGAAGGGNWNKPGRPRIDSDQPGQKTLWKMVEG